MAKTTMHLLCLLGLMLLALEGAGAQRVEPALSDQKPNPATSTKSATASFFGAVIDENEELVRRLIQQNPALLRASNAHGTALHFAVGHDKILELLLAKHMDVNAKNELGDTPLHIAAVEDLTASAELLLANKADVNAANLEGDTPLHSPGSKEMAELLVTKGANIEARNNEGRTPLHTAVKNGLTEIIEYLLSHHADANAKDNEGNTPLHLQMEPEENREWIKRITELLLANKADVNAKNNEGVTPLMIAIEQKNKGAIALLQGIPRN
jgi:ankyrin repeat protein